MIPGSALGAVAAARSGGQRGSLVHGPACGYLDRYPSRVRVVVDLSSRGGVLVWSEPVLYRGDAKRDQEERLDDRVL